MVDLVNTLDRDDVRQPEGLYFDFPFEGLKDVGVRFNTAWAAVQLEKDLLPGACKNWFCVQDWVELSSRQQTVVFAPVDAPLIEIGQIHANGRTSKLPEVGRLDFDPPRILSFVMNNYWHTNYRASQPGTASFRYRIYCYDGPSDPVATMRRGVEARAPLRTALVPPANKGALPAGEHAFLTLSPDQVMVTAVVPARRGGTLIRLQEIAGKRARVALNVPGFGGRAERVDMWERPLEPVELRAEKIAFESAPHEIVTLRIF